MSAAATPIADRAMADAGTAPVDAVARLGQSRLRLRQHLIALNGNQAGPAGSQPLTGWLGSLRSIPLLGTALDTVSGWWSRHPLRVVATVLAASTASAVRPVAQRHPAWSVFGALAVGGLVMWAKPWRIALLRRVVYAGLLPQLVSKALSHPPTTGWLSLAESVLRRGPTPAPSAGPATAMVIHANLPAGSDFTRTSPLR